MATKNLQRLYIAVRSLSVLVCLQIISEFISPALWILYEPASIVSKMARLSSSPEMIACLWFLSAAAVVPFVVMQIFAPWCKYRRMIMKISNFGMIGGASVWLFLAFAGRNLDYSFATWNFVINTFKALGMVAMMANSLNNDQKEKETLEAAHEA